ncbi:hypothetical protein EVA_22505 [gut metagenome]|uniref:Uncharacterized protein n=1 Tax=gut metagenome TaxID=749906 RepID=J9FI92_9ZZZZ
MHGFARIVLHHRHMLVSRRMKHIDRTIVTEHLFHARGITDGRHNRVRLDVGVVLAHIKTHIVHRRFGLVNQHQTARCKFCNLAHHFATNTACSPCNQDTGSLELTAYRIQVDLNLLAGQQILNLDLFQHRMIQCTLSVPFLNGRKHTNTDARLY